MTQVKRELLKSTPSKKNGLVLVFFPWALCTYTAPPKLEVFAVPAALFLMLLESDPISHLKVRVPAGAIYGITEMGCLYLGLSAAVLVILGFVE